jgi:hypothetical protein
MKMCLKSCVSNVVSVFASFSHRLPSNETDFADVQRVKSFKVDEVDGASLALVSPKVFGPCKDAIL